MKRLTGMTLAGAMVVLLAGCGGAGSVEQNGSAEANVSSTQDAAADVAEKVSLKISHHPYIHGLPTTYAEEHGLYDMFDYTVDYYAGGPVQNEAIASGAWEVGTTGIAGAVLGITGYDMKILGVVCDEAAVTDMWCRSDFPLANAEPQENGVLGTAEDWKGLTVLIAGGTNTQLMLSKQLEALGLEESDVNITDCSSVPNVYAAFMAGEGDVAFLWSPYGYELAKDETYTKVGTIEDLGVSLPSFAVCTAEAYQNRPEVVETWLTQYYKACDALAADTENAAKLLYDFEESQGIVMSEEAAALEIENRPFWSVAENQEFFTAGNDGTSQLYTMFMDYAEFMLSQGKITQEQYDKMLDGSFQADTIMKIK